MNAGTNKDRTELLTKVGFLFLKKMGCYEIGTEVTMFYRSHDFSNKLDQHSIIDLVGVQWGYSQVKPSHDILRGIEVKVSRSDYQHGFIQTGCHFNYLMTPKGLISPKLLRRNIGLIEVDIENFKAAPLRFSPFLLLSGVEVSKFPKRQTVDELTLTRCKEQLASSLTAQVRRWLLSELNGHNEFGEWDEKPVSQGGI